jgi:predicted RNase H-like HicB family nuclease
MEPYPSFGRGKLEEYKMVKNFIAYIEWDPETNLFVGIVPGIPGAHTQAATLDELQGNLKEVLELCLEEFEGSPESLPRFVGVQQIELNL